MWSSSAVDRRRSRPSRACAGACPPCRGRPRCGASRAVRRRARCADRSRTAGRPPTTAPAPRRSPPRSVPPARRSGRPRRRSAWPVGAASTSSARTAEALRGGAQHARHDQGLARCAAPGWPARRAGWWRDPNMVTGTPSCGQVAVGDQRHDVAARAARPASAGYGGKAAPPPPCRWRVGRAGSRTARADPSPPPAPRRVRPCADDEMAVRLEVAQVRHGDHRSAAHDRMPDAPNRRRGRCRGSAPRGSTGSAAAPASSGRGSRRRAAPSRADGAIGGRPPGGGRRPAAGSPPPARGAAAPGDTTRGRPGRQAHRQRLAAASGRPRRRPAVPGAVRCLASAQPAAARVQSSPRRAISSAARARSRASSSLRPDRAEHVPLARIGGDHGAQLVGQRLGGAEDLGRLVAGRPDQRQAARRRSGRRAVRWQATGSIGAPERADSVAGPAGKVVGSPRNSTGTSPGR